MTVRGRILCAGVLLLGCGARTLPVNGNPTTNIAIDDEIGSICATKADGQYRCWNGDGTSASAAPLPDADHVRVQLTAAGLVGLTRGGSLTARDVPVSPGLPPIAQFRAFNMWGSQGLCLRSNAGGFLYGTYNPDPNFFPEGSRWYSVDGTFIDTTCAFEGLYGAVRSDGTIWNGDLAAMPGNDWRTIAIGWAIACGLTSTGNVMCLRRSFVATDPAPSFPPARYLQVAATFQTACALRADGAILCSRFDGAAIASPTGRYVFLDAGRDLLCAIRSNGTSACFRQNGQEGAFSFGDYTVTAFVPLSPAVEEGW